MEIVDIHSFATMDMDSESRVIPATNARQIRNMRLNEFGKSGVLVSMRGTKKIHGVRVEPPVIHTVGSINVGIGIQDLPEDATHFRIILTGRSEARPVFSEYINQQQSVTFADIPLDTYDVTQELPSRYTNVSIVENPITISESNRYANVWVLNKQVAPIKYGALYNWFVAMGGLAPEGYHLPSYDEWQTLITELGGSAIAGGKLKEAGLEHWIDPNTGADNSTGFTARPSGSRLPTEFLGFGSAFSCWTSTLYPYDITYPWSAVMYNNYANVFMLYANKYRGLSVRFLFDYPELWSEGAALIDIEGNIYDLIKVGEQVWMDSNYKCTKLADGTPIDIVEENTVWNAGTTPAMCFINNDPTTA